MDGNSCRVILVDGTDHVKSGKLKSVWHQNGQYRLLSVGQVKGFPSTVFASQPGLIRKMKVLLIRPNSQLRSMFMPLGLGYIADAVRKAGHDVWLLDARLKRMTPEQVVRYVDDIQPNVIGISAIHFEKKGTMDLARALKSAGIDVPIVLGGPLVSTSGEGLVEQGMVDVAVIGEGEQSFMLYLQALDNSADITGIPGLISKDMDGAVSINPPGLFQENIEDRVPAWDLIGPQKYFRRFGRFTQNAIRKSHRSVSIFTSRGCPFGCLYCHNVFGRKFRPRTAEAVLGEIMMLKQEYGIKELEIVDDCFNLDLVRAKRIANGIIDQKLDLNISFSNGLRVDRMDEELVDLLKKAGTYRINYAIETASPRLQKLIEKNLDLERANQVISYTAGKGIFTFGYFMMGFPTETEEEMLMTRDYALHSKLHAASFFYVNPFPGTELYKRYAVSRSGTEAIENMDYTDLKVNLSQVSDEILRCIVKESYRKLHFSPGRMWRTFRVVPKNSRTIWAVGITSMLSLKDAANW